MTKINQNPNDSPTQPNFKIGFKETLFLFGLLSWASPIYILGNILSAKKDNDKSISGLFLLVAVFSLVTLLFGINESILKLIICLSIAVWLVLIDCDHNRFFDNATIHFCNSIFLGLAVYFVAIDLYLEVFPEPIQDLMKSVGTSLPKAFNMLVLCLIFQNVGYYLVWDLLKNSSSKWFTSRKNLVNLDFIRTPRHQINLFSLLMGLGLLFRISSIATGKFFYLSASEAENSGVDFSVASFIAQFEPLYKVAWFYGLALLFGRDNDTTIDLKNTHRSANKFITRTSLIFIALELFYQLISGSKGRFLAFVIIPFGTIFFFTHRRVSTRALIIGLFIGVLSLLLIFPTLVIYRSVITSTVLGGNATFITFFQKAWDTLQSLSWQEYQDIVLTPFNSAGNSESVSAMISIIHFQGDVTLDAGILWQRLLLFWVPRFLWSDKPTIASTNVVGRLTGRLSADDFGTSVLTTAPGELFIYYGLFGSVLMILLGIVARWFNEATSPFKDFTAFRAAVYFSYLPSVINIVGGAGFEGAITGLVLQMFTLYASLYAVRFFG